MKWAVTIKVVRHLKLRGSVLEFCHDMQVKWRNLRVAAVLEGLFYLQQRN